ncbi:glycosyltransferase [Listeria grandensis FSL F6-0971]|uniref:Glycosyltransferase n=1 Tax=Listeria grandensis FSL F6-0971 TaxID=1265819 RepID=W7AZT4_9LIST|nr:glycosyltransferase family 2 protein [Listeria grandensis]EUJ18735.1 glycosyltransferase [Listeria grandensis FSL F6-0971]
MRDLVSVIIPTRNRVRALEQAIKSVFKQTYTSIEICVVIDGEDDETKQMLEKYSGGEIDVRIYQTKGVGGATARNIGVQMARGKWIALLDDDDEFLPDKIEQQLALLDDNPNVRHLSFTSVLTYPAENKKKTFILPATSWNDKYTVGEYLFCRHRRKTLGFIQTSTLLIPRKLLLEVRFTDGLKKHQDWDLILRMEQAGIKIKHLNSAKTIYHKQISNEKRTGQQNIWRFSEEWIDTVVLSRQARDSFLLSIVIRGIATDRSLSMRERQREIMARIGQVKWNWRNIGNYFYMACINMIRIYIK